MDDPIKELGFDIEELKEILEKTAKRKNVKTLLNAWISKLDGE